jgi:hypothetical protein
MGQGSFLGAHCSCAKRTNPSTRRGARKDFVATGNQSRPQSIFEKLTNPSLSER